MNSEQSNVTHIKTWLSKLHYSTSIEQPNKLPKQILTLAEIKIDWLKNAGIRGVILDLDNTIISEDDRYLSPWAEDWIAEAKLAGLKLFILSNGKRRYRVKYWSHRLDINAISPAKKPFPSAFRKAMTQMRLSSKNVLVIGDSLHTDIMGAKLSGCLCIQVASLPHPPRWWEKLAGKWVQIPYPNGKELWDFEGAFGYKIFS
ncbi:YqeG family HAD IIIA-type phosphatase [Nostoc parmelioides]|uniref:YqeG family HAD IIIA-type phosphatase n=1 Tax=Nostoc parmelioides FACHB-3921 TaxID=2692909 RepID=A0ABR8BCP1_9NOSO|nr:YqeG family HAD IIIA-type phosphatase [Nostoc parmelioides]MBD2251309.1 YqeG family HAD IIIA-type phosphatase [Nostoc parmelioides FACHB-3921]